MSRDLPNTLQDYIRSRNKELADRADNFWRISQPILDRQSSANSNENGLPHVEMVERNVWRLIKESGKVSEFNSHELFILSCGACCHDFDKGLLNKPDDETIHGEGSGEYLIKEFQPLLQSFPEAVAIKSIIGIHDYPDGKFQEELKKIDKIFPLSTGPVKLQKLAVLLKTADVLHTDSSRIAHIGIDLSSMSEKEKDKHLARESITGWFIDGTRIIINAAPQTQEHLSALHGCIKYIKDKEWPAVEDKLSDYDFPHDLEFTINKSICGEPPEPKKKL